MTLTTAPNTKLQAISVTNFDLSSLYLLRPEISVTLSNAERHLSEFNRSTAQAPLLLESVAMLKQLSSVLKLIALSGGSQLASVLAEAMQRLFDLSDSDNDSLALATSQGIMSLNRYIEFVLLQETLVPKLLVPAINQINEALGKQKLNPDNLVNNNYTNIALANPAQNFTPLEDLDLDIDLLSTAYRAGLKVLLSNEDGVINKIELKSLQAMSQSCTLIAKKSESLFWRAAEVATLDTEQLLPLTAQQKHLFIFVDQQFYNYLPADDKRFAELVSFACLRENELALSLQEALKVNQLDDTQISKLKKYLFGPDQQTTSVLNDIIQNEISDIKNQLSTLLESDKKSENDKEKTQTPVAREDIDPIIAQLKQLASTMRILGLDDAESKLFNSITIINSWTSSAPTDLELLLNELMVAENAAINLSKSRTPGAQTNPYHNKNISIHQLDTAFLNLIDESRKTLVQIEHLVNDYMNEVNNIHRDVDFLKEMPTLLQQVAGALRFLELTDAANLINRLSQHLNDTLYIDDNILEDDPNATYNKFSKVADVMLAIDHILSAAQKNHPISKHTMDVGNRSLVKLIAA